MRLVGTSSDPRGHGLAASVHPMSTRRRVAAATVVPAERVPGGERGGRAEAPGAALTLWTQPSLRWQHGWRAPQGRAHHVQKRMPRPLPGRLRSEATPSRGFKIRSKENVSLPSMRCGCRCGGPERALRCAALGRPGVHAARPRQPSSASSSMMPELARPYRPAMRRALPVRPRRRGFRSAPSHCSLSVSRLLHWHAILMSVLYGTGRQGIAEKCRPWHFFVPTAAQYTPAPTPDRKRPMNQRSLTSSHGVPRISCGSK